jgi:type I restriction enzyme S subunit
MTHPCVALEECCEFLDHIRRPVKESERVNGPYPYFGANGQQGWINDYLFDEPLVLLAEDGGHFSSPERGIAYKIIGKTWVNNHAHVLRPREGIIDVDYLAHALKNKDVRRHLSGSTRDKLTKAGACQIEIPLPTLEEQRRIAAILDKASRIAELCGTALKLSHAADKSLFLHFFADLPEESDFLLEELADKRSNAIRTGPFGSQLLHGEFTDSGIAVLGIDNAVTNSFEWSKRRFISHEKYEQLKRYAVFPGDLIITIMGTCGRAAVVPDDIPEAINTKHLCAISVDRSVVLPEYLHSYILFHPSASRYLSQRTKGAIMEGLNMTIIKELPVAVPPVSDQMAWLARRKILRAASKRAQSMSASALSLRQSFSYNLLEERGA